MPRPKLPNSGFAPRETAHGAQVALKWARLLFWYTCGQFVVFKASVVITPLRSLGFVAVRKVAHLKCIKELGPRTCCRAMNVMLADGLCEPLLDRGASCLAKPSSSTWMMKPACYVSCLLAALRGHQL